MKRFAALYQELDATTRTGVKVEAMTRYFREAPPRDAAWGLFFLTGRREKRLLAGASLVEWALEAAGVQPWLLQECFAAVGDFAETVALLLEEKHAPQGAPSTELGAQGELFQATTDLATVPGDGSLASWVEERIQPLRTAKPPEQRRAVLAWWRALDTAEVFMLTKLLTGEMRVGVQQTLVMKALAQAAGLPEADVRPKAEAGATAPEVRKAERTRAAVNEIAARLMGPWEPTEAFFKALLSREDGPSQRAAASAVTIYTLQPYPFALASPLETPPDALGERGAWLAEWKWDGIRAQIVRRESVAIWTRGEELATERFPEVERAARALPRGTVLDGEILAWRDGRPLPFGELQTRIGRKKLSKALLESTPIVFLAFDLLEASGEDVRAKPLTERRALLMHFIKSNPGVLLLSEEVAGETWSDLALVRESARERGVEGFLLKRLDSPYGVGRKKGDWWKWKVDPYTIDAVLVAAEPGHGKRASLFTDYTFAVRHEGELLPIAKAYSGLDDAEIKELDAWIRAHTRDRFGRVRRVEPVRVFEIAFEAIGPSNRHKSGLAVRFPRIVRERTAEKTADEADTLESVRALLRTPPPTI